MTEEQEQQQSASPTPPETPEFASVVPLDDYCTDSLQAWFRNINSMFAVSCIMRSITKFHMAVIKLPVLLMDTIGYLCDDPTAVDYLYAELQAILLQSYCLSTAQKTARLLDHQ
jgi:hypothetical protein